MRDITPFITVSERDRQESGPQRCPLLNPHGLYMLLSEQEGLGRYEKVADLDVEIIWDYSKVVMSLQSRELSQPRPQRDEAQAEVRGALLLASKCARESCAVIRIHKSRLSPGAQKGTQPAHIQLLRG